MTATKLRPIAQVSTEILALMPLKMDMKRTNEESVAIKAVISLFCRVPQRQRIPTRIEIEGHAYTPLQMGIVLDAYNWLEGADQPAPSKTLARLLAK